MEQIFSVTVCGQHVGKVVLQKQGLYYHFSCRCQLSGDMIYRLMVICDKTQESLGILVPKGDCFILDTKLPAKRFGTRKLQFILVPKRDRSYTTFIPIRADEPFSYISRLKESFLTIRDGQPGICLDPAQNR